MTGTINPELPEKGEGKGVSDARIRGSLITLRDELNALLNTENKIQKSALETGLGAIKWYSPKVVATEQSRENTSFGTLGTADEIKEVVVPENGLLLLGFIGLVKSSVSATGRIAFFLGSNQLKINGGEAPATQEASTEGTNFSTILSSFGGLRQGGGGTSFVTTGQVIANLATSPNSVGGLCSVFIAPGTYNISVQYKASSGSVTAKERKLWCAVLG